MKYKIIAAIILGFVFTGIAFTISASEMNSKSLRPQPTPTRKIEFDGVRIVRSDAEWKKILTPNQFYILRQKGTEQPYTGEYTDNKAKGTYHCAACGLALFRSSAKYDSQTGWPSFYQPIAGVNVVEETDTSIPEETRIEILCARCNSHLGHVFDDGPEPTGLRYCINSISLKFGKPPANRNKKN